MGDSNVVDIVPQAGLTEPIAGTPPPGAYATAGAGLTASAKAVLAALTFMGIIAVSVFVSQGTTGSEDPPTVRLESGTETSAPTPTDGFVVPTAGPTLNPTFLPTFLPSAEPTLAPAYTGTQKPSKMPTTLSPTMNPTKIPTKNPTKMPTKNPTQLPTKNPTKMPTKTPTTKAPVIAPVEWTLEPTPLPTETPSSSPSKSPTKKPTRQPTGSPTKEPTEWIITTEKPTLVPTWAPTDWTLADTEDDTKYRIPTVAPTKDLTSLSLVSSCSVDVDLVMDMSKSIKPDQVELEQEFATNMVEALFRYKRPQDVVKISVSTFHKFFIRHTEFKDSVASDKDGLVDLIHQKFNQEWYTSHNLVFQEVATYRKKTPTGSKFNKLTGQGYALVLISDGVPKLKDKSYSQSRKIALKEYMKMKDNMPEMQVHCYSPRIINEGIDNYYSQICDTYFHETLEGELGIQTNNMAEVLASRICARNPSNDE